MNNIIFKVNLRKENIFLLRLGEIFSSFEYPVSRSSSHNICNKIKISESSGKISGFRGSQLAGIKLIKSYNDSLFLRDILLILQLTQLVDAVHHE